jgi:flavodoxin I
LINVNVYHEKLLYDTCKKGGSREMDTLIVYISMTGTTEMLARQIGEGLTHLGERVVVKDAFMTEAEELLSYDRVLIGSYTWGDGELPDEALDFFKEVKELDLAGKSGAVFGMGDSTYRYFARAVDIWEEALGEQGCTLTVKALKIDRDFDTDMEPRCLEFCRLLKETSAILAN